MDTIDQIAVERSQTQEDGPAPVVAVEGLRKSFGSQSVLSGIGLQVTRGETLAVLGAQWHRQERVAAAHHRPREA